MALPTFTRMSNFNRAFGGVEPTCLVTPLTLADFNWHAQNQAFIQQFALSTPYLVARVFWRNGSGASGSSWDLGIYDANLARLYSTTSTAASGNSVMQYVTLNTALSLPPGLYYIALANNNATLTNRAFGISTIATNEGRAGGLSQMAAAFPLPATLVPAQWASTGMPICGIARSSSGF